MFSLINIDRGLTIQFVLLILGIITLLGNLISLWFSGNDRKKAKNSELSAMSYAEQADKYYKKIIKFYDNEEEKQQIELELLKKEKVSQQKYELEQAIYALVRKEGLIKTSKCAIELHISELEAFDILYKMQRVDRRIGSAGSPNRDNVNSNNWTSRV